MNLCWAELLLAPGLAPPSPALLPCRSAHPLPTLSLSSPGAPICSPPSPCPPQGPPSQHCCLITRIWAAPGGSSSRFPLLKQGSKNFAGLSRAGTSCQLRVKQPPSQIPHLLGKKNKKQKTGTRERGSSALRLQRGSTQKGIVSPPVRTMEDDFEREGRGQELWSTKGLILKEKRKSGRV